MKLVYQTISGGEFANCLQAAVASYFDLKLSRVPNFMLFGKQYWGAFNYFVWSLGYELFGYVEGLPPKDGRYYIVSIDFGAKHESSHSVIWKDGIITHDPYEAGINQKDNITGYYKIEKRG